MDKFLLFWLILLMACQKPKFINEDTNFPSLDGESVFQLQNEPYSWLLINFFAPKCPPCIEELNDLKNFYLTKKSQEGFIAIGSTLEAIESPEETLDKIKLEVRNFAKEHSIPYPIYIADYFHLKSYNIKGFPETLIFKKINGTWQLEKKFISAITQAQIDLYRD